jgi:hypothetical protein
VRTSPRADHRVAIVVATWSAMAPPLPRSWTSCAAHRGQLAAGARGSAAVGIVVDTADGGPCWAGAGRMSSHGVWLARQLCDRVDVQLDDDAVRVQARLSRAAP